MYLIPFPSFFGLLTPHIPRAHLKKSFETLWEKENALLTLTNTHRFRNKEDVSIYIFYLWQILKGEFVPHNCHGDGRMISFKNESEIDKVCSIIEGQKKKMLCINDECSEEIFELAKDRINNSFLKMFPEKSGFEK